MNIWENTVLTDQGKVLQAKLLKGQTLKIKRAATGTKKVPVVDLRQQTSVTEGGYDLTLQPARTEGDKTVIPVLLENKGLNESYDLWQVGFYAEDPDEGEILFCLSQASQAKNIPAEAESPGFSITWDFYFNTSDTAPFEVVLDSAGLVSIEQYQIHTDEINKVSGKIDCLNSVLETLGTKITDVRNVFGYGTFHNGFIQIGKLVCVSFGVGLAANIAAGKNLCSGLPKPLSDIAILNVYNGVISSYSRAKVTSDGVLYVESAHNSGDSLLVNGAYIAK